MAGPVTQAEGDRIVQLYHELGNAKAVSRVVGRHHATIARALEQRGVRVPRRIEVGEAEAARIVSDYTTYRAITVVARIHARGHATIRAVLERAGVELPTLAPQLSAADVAWASSAYAAGGSLRELAARLGKDREAVRRALLAAGISMRSRGGWHRG